MIYLVVTRMLSRLYHYPPVSACCGCMIYIVLTRICTTHCLKPLCSYVHSYRLLYVFIFASPVDVDAICNIRVYLDYLRLLQNSRIIKACGLVPLLVRPVRL